jgi:hypothetical protein
VAFNINDRTTWAWIDDAVAESRANNGYLLKPQDKTSSYQLSNGVPYKHYERQRAAGGVLGDQVEW